MKVTPLQTKDLKFGTKLLIESTQINLPELALVTVMEPSYQLENHISVNHNGREVTINLSQFILQQGPVTDIRVVEVGME